VVFNSGSTFVNRLTVCWYVVAKYLNALVKTGTSKLIALKNLIH
jgi:hypothetical protein